MKKLMFNKVDEAIYHEKLDCGVNVYLYPKTNTKNFYITIFVKYGAKYMKYSLNNKEYDVIPGSAHFLEHKVMAISENEEISKRINNYGSTANAWTSYDGTNYNIFGSIDPIGNLELLLDIFYNIKITEKNVNEEKGIIGEEIDLYKDQIEDYMYDRLFKNVFHESYMKHDVAGERSDIEEITAKSLNKIYDDYYISNNTYITMSGNFDKDEAIKFIKEYISKLNLKPKELPKRIIAKEPDSVVKEYEEIKKDIEDVRIKYAIKIPRKNFNIEDNNILRYYLGIVLSSNLSATSSLYEKYKKENIATGIGHNIYVIDDHVLIIINGLCVDGEKFINNIEKDIKKLTIDEETFDRKKKLGLKAFILDFDNIENVEYNISNSIMIDGKIDFDEYYHIDEMTYEKCIELLNSITYDNISIIRTIK